MRIKLKLKKKIKYFKLLLIETIVIMKYRQQFNNDKKIKRCYYY